VKFSIYTEIQWWPGKEPAQVYAEVLEQIENADRLGYDAYAAIEHFFFPKFSASPDPISLFAAASQRTSRINFRTLVHVLPYHNPMILASRIAFADVLLGGRYEFGVGRGHGWIPWRAGLPYAEMVERYDESLEILFTALESKGEPVSHEGKFFTVHDARIVPPPTRKFRVFTGGTSDKTYVLAGTKGWGVVVPPLLPYEALREQLDLYRATCAEHGNEPDIVWIHACYLDEDRDTAIREAEHGIKGFLAGNASPLVEHERPPADELTAAGYGFYTAGILEGLAETPYEETIAQDIVWVGTPEDVIERIEAVRDLCEGLTEIAITVNPGGVDHWQAIKNQELFAHRVMPHFKGAAARKEAATA
jgi:alkanesulfonate monooxygenase SsuD/methylene tetrahydromethanopterin reductase-like flavin-dependent oxidoreductase (luciferase family)